MKATLIIIGLMISLSGFGQEHVDYCYADSVVVGYEFITEEGENWYSSMAAYNREYIGMFDNIEHKIFSPYPYFFEPIEVYQWLVQWHRQEYQRYAFGSYTGLPNNYIRYTEIKLPQQPTFEGYVKWLEKLIQ